MRHRDVFMQDLEGRCEAAASLAFTLKLRWALWWGKHVVAICCLTALPWGSSWAYNLLCLILDLPAASLTTGIGVYLLFDEEHHLLLQDTPIPRLAAVRTDVDSSSSGSRSWLPVCPCSPLLYIHPYFWLPAPCTSSYSLKWENNITEFI